VNIGSAEWKQREMKNEKAEETIIGQ
jgi:hypothetical protein